MAGMVFLSFFVMNWSCLRIDRCIPRGVGVLGSEAPASH